MFKIINGEGNLEKNLQLGSEQNFVKNQKEVLISHFDTFNFGKNSYLNQLISKKKGVISENDKKTKENELWCFSSDEKSKEYHLSFDSSIENIDYFQRFTFLSNISTLNVIHICKYDLENDSKVFKDLIVLLFKNKMNLERFRNGGKEKISFLLHIDPNDNHETYLPENLFQSLKFIWLKTLNDFNLHDSKKNNLLFEQFDLQLHVTSVKYNQSSEDENQIVNLFENTDNNLSHFSSGSFLTLKDNGEIQLGEDVEKSWISAKSIFLIPELHKSGKIVKKIEPTFTSEILFNNLWKFACGIIRKWNKSVNRGRVIDNFGQKVSKFLNELISEFDKSLPENYREEQIFVDKIQKLSDMLKERVTSIFTKQILTLQTQALDKYKDSLLKSISDNDKDFDMEKKIISEKIDLWFEENAQKIIVNEIGLTSEGAREELRNVMIEFSEKFKESPAVKLHAMQKLEKQTSNSGLKQSGVVIGFGLTAAVRPRGYGNLQFVSSYSHGPHVLNFSLVNDRDVAEQEGQAKVKAIRLQPSLNFDVDL